MDNMFTSNRIQNVHVEEAEQHTAQVVYNIYNFVSWKTETCYLEWRLSDMLSIGVIIRTHHLCAECWTQKPRSRKTLFVHTPQSVLYFIHEHEKHAALLTTALETTLTQRPVTEGGILTNKFIFQQSHEAKRERLEVNIGHPGRKVLL